MLISAPKTSPTLRSSRPSNGAVAAFSSSSIDAVALSTAASQALEPAAHLRRATEGYLALVETHPTERDEFLSGVAEIQEVVAEILYGGHWPDADELPALPAGKKPGEAAKNGGLTRSEQLVSEDFVQLYRKTASSVTGVDQHKRLAAAIHLCQSSLQGRVLRRDYPDYWLSSQGSLSQDAQQEKTRWP